MSRPTGNTRLKAARIAAGFVSQQALADALSAAARELGIRGLMVGVRQVRRWESANPPWPQPDCQRLLTHVLGQDIRELGFTPPWGQETGARPSGAASGRRPPVPVETTVSQPDTAATDFATITRAHRRLYWSVVPSVLHATVMEHARLGCALLPQTSGAPRRTMAAALAESFLLAGRIEFFDLRDSALAQETLVQALQAAGEADDALLGAAILAHTAFIPGWVGDREKVAERMTAARTYARRAPASAEVWAWLDAVEAECLTRCGDNRAALHLLGHAEDVLATGAPHTTPAWMDWFDAIRLAAFKGNAQLRAGHLPQARETLLGVVTALRDGKQRTVILGDLAAVEAAANRPEEACRYASEALDQLSETWYAMGMDRVREVRRALKPWESEGCVRELDDRLYGWSTTVSALGKV
ncbi:transcriptional regulator [Streptomyces sp. NPDC049879]|uniref:transcriptional regulator n=1 Tax=Streptomyces sp. NPDC049879 TaxID=3365598 RepID=UPI00378C23FE